MAQATYDISSPQSLLEYARGLSGKTLAEVVDMSRVAENISNKGDLGNMVERYYYRYQPDNTTHLPDFPCDLILFQLGSYSCLKSRIVPLGFSVPELAPWLTYQFAVFLR